MSTPSFFDALASFVARETSDLFFPLPCRVERYDAEKQLADVLPLIRFPVALESGETEFQSLPVVPSCPVVFPGFGPWALTFPVSVGDRALVLFSGAALDEWIATGGLSTPKLQRKASLCDGIVIPGLRSPVEALPSASSDALILGHSEGSKIAIQDNAVRLGTVDASSLVALASKVEAELNALRTVLNNHLHSGVTPGSAASGPLLTPAGAIGSTAATGVYATDS